MIGRRTSLVLSVLVSLAVHGALLYYAPRIPVMQAVSAEVMDTAPFRIDLRQDVTPEPEPPAPRENVNLAYGPGGIEDLLKRPVDEVLRPEEGPAAQAADLPQLAERIAAEPLQRAIDPTPPPDVLKQVDARLVEISESEARQDLQIARRLVEPSPDRVLTEHDFPVLGGGPSDTPEEALVFNPVPASFGTDVIGTIDSGPGAERLPLPVLERPRASQDLLAMLPDEPTPTEAPVLREIRSEKKYEFLDDLLDVRLETYVPKGEERGYFRVQIIPKGAKGIEAIPKTVTFVIDASRSILQRKLDLSADAVRGMVSTLRADDTFNVVVFRDSPSQLQPGPVPATEENKAAAARFLTGLQSSGQTDVYRAIQPVVLEPGPQGRPRMVVVISDGRPTTGIVDGRTIINELTADNTLRTPIYALGGGNTVNRFLLDLLAYRNKGEATVIENLNSLKAGFQKQFARINDPILVDCRANFGGIAESQLFPREIPDFYLGRAVTVYGMYAPRSDRSFVMRLVGNAGRQQKEVIFRASFAEATPGDEGIARMWAFEKIYFLIGEICRIGETPELLAEVRRLSSTYRIQTSYAN